MENNAELIKQCEARAQKWLSPAFDEETRNKFRQILTIGKISVILQAI